MSFSLMMAPFLLFFHTMTGQVQLSIIHYTAAAAKGLDNKLHACWVQKPGTWRPPPN
jgi:hypothetical protein